MVTMIEAIDEAFRHAHDPDLECDLSTFENGDVRVCVGYRDRGDYAGYVWIVRDGQIEHYWIFDDLHAPQCLTADSPLQGGYDCEAALAHMAQSAVSFADHFTADDDWNRYGEAFSNAACGEHDEDGPVFKAVTR